MKEPRIVCYNAPIDMRLSEDGLAQLVSQHGHQLDSGDVFIFFNSKRNQCKIVWYDSTGYCSIDRRLEDGIYKQDISISDDALYDLLSDGFFGSETLMSTLRSAGRGKIMHISAAKSAKHFR